MAPAAPTSRSVLWGHHAPILDQGQLGSCTGNALSQALNTDYLAAGRAPIGGAYLGEADAVKLYSRATTLDSDPANYPPTDTGASGLTVAKAGVQLGYLKSYQHCFGFDHFAAALQLSPLIVGTDWLSNMFNPNSKGHVSVTGSVEGGHEYLALGIDYAHKTLTFLNSWGASWGVGGRFTMSFAGFTKLLNAQGDATVPVV